MQQLNKNLLKKYYLLLKKYYWLKFDPTYHPWCNKRRSNQTPPEGNWKTWLIMAGRGFGKTRTGAETIQQWVEEGLYKRIALISNSRFEAQAVMVNGESGICNIANKLMRPKFIKNEWSLIWPNGAMAQLFGAEYCEKLRGPQFDLVWIDELGKFKNQEALWNQVQLCLRLGKKPRTIITTTPKPSKFLENLINDKTVFVTRGTTFDNYENLSTNFIEQIKNKYTNTTLGQQEIYGQYLSENDGALWKRNLINYKKPESSDWRRIIIAIDPATTYHEHSDETGIIAAGLNNDGYVYVLEDLSGKFSPNDWAQKVIQEYHHHHADCIVVETNKGGDLVEKVLKAIDSNIPFKGVVATKGKITRAEPIAALYEQKKIFHIKPFHKLEQQLCTYVASKSSKSPDRMDALVWAITDLMLESNYKSALKVWNFE